MGSIRITLLGTGTSHGVPMIACDCAVCTSNDPHDKRMRSSIFIEAGGASVLVDTTPELRLQCVAGNVRRVDAVLFTHAHADHVVGLDDLRRFNWIQQGAIPCYGDANTLRILRTMFSYAFEERPDYPSAKPNLELREISGVIQVGETTITPIPLFHGPLPILGFRLGAFAYCTDCSVIPEASFDLLKDLDVLVLDALRRRPHPTHFNLEQAIEAARRIGARETYFTHIAHELGHAATNAELPAGMALGYDGQVIEVAGG